MSDSDDKKKEGQQTPPETRLYSTPGVDPNETIDSSSAPSFSDPNLDALSERFALIQELGRGGMGVVYKARDKVTDEIIALKVLRPEIAQDPALIERFKNEVRLSKKITHKNVCRIHDLHLIGGTAAITMEFVEGETLRAWLRKNEVFAISRGTKLATQIISGLKEAHDQGVVHRDLKPENLMLTPEGNIKIMDFGIARSLEGSTTVTEGLTGTPAYMSPEQAEGKEIDHRTDIYALGLILYEMFTGQMAFTGDTPVAIAFKQVHETPTKPTRVDPYVPKHIDWAILKCLEKKPEHRFSSVEELQLALSRESGTVSMETASQPALNTLPEPSPTLLVWARRDWLLLVIALVSIAYFFSSRDRVFPASAHRLEVDAITARKEAERVAGFLNRTLPPNVSTKLRAASPPYSRVLINRFRQLKPPTPEARYHELQNLPPLVYWEVIFSSATAGWAPVFSDLGGDAIFRVTPRGKVIEFSMSSLSTEGLANYKPPPLETRRLESRKIIENLCEEAPLGTRIVDWAGGPMAMEYWSEFYTGPQEVTAPWAEIAMRRERVESFRCQPQKMGRAENSAFRDLGMERIGQFFLWAILFGVVFMIITVVFTLTIGGHLNSARLIWRYIPLGIPVGFSFVWVVAPVWLQGQHASFPLLIGGGLALSVTLTLALVCLELYLALWSPSFGAAWLHLQRGRIDRPLVGFGLVRGVLVGFSLLAIETALANLSIWLGISPGDPLSYFIDPSTLTGALTTTMTSGYVLAASLVSAIPIGALFVGIGIASAERKKKKARRSAKGKKWEKWAESITLGAAIVFSLMIVGLPPSFSVQVANPMGLYAAIPLMIFLGVVIFQYDLLTIVFGLFTATLWGISYPLVSVLAEVGNNGQLVLLSLWAALTVAGILIAFREKIADWWETKKSDF